MPATARILPVFCLMQVIAIVCQADAILLPSSITAQGSFTNASALVGDSVIPSEGTSWTAPTNLYWSGQTGESGVVFTYDFGAPVTITELQISTDNNDSLGFEVSNDNISYSHLAQITIGDGEIFFGMDTMSSDSTHAEYEPNFDFAPATGRYLRFYARAGDGNFSVGEVQAFGFVVPEPSSFCIVNFVFATSALCRRRKLEFR
ncbi:MAG: discoidin domain-containing protein [Planctomycetota bacterium]